MLRADVIMVETVGFLASKSEDLLCAWCKVIHHWSPEFQTRR
jgi:hypothetical protein